MKTIGLLGGMSWESTVEYYRLINQGVNQRLGRLHSAQLLMHSVDFEPMELLQHQGKWAELTEQLADISLHLQDAGADFLVLATNTMHVCTNGIERSVRIPLLHIADATGEEIKRQGLKKVGLLGTRFTMEQDFYRGRLEKKFGLSVLVPGPEDRQAVHDVIYNELCLGKILPESRLKYGEVVRRLADAGAEGVVLGCTEIPLLVKQEDSPVPLFDTTALHCKAAVDWALKD